MKTLRIISKDLYDSAKNLSYMQLLEEITFLGEVIDQINLRIHTRKYKSKKWSSEYISIVSDMYLDYLPFLYKYIEILDLIKLGKEDMAKYVSFSDQSEIPSFLTDEFLKYNIRLLFHLETKPLYFIKGKWIYYDN